MIRLIGCACLAAGLALSACSTARPTSQPDTPIPADRPLTPLSPSAVPETPLPEGTALKPTRQPSVAEAYIAPDQRPVEGLADYSEMYPVPPTLVPCLPEGMRGTFVPPPDLRPSSEDRTPPPGQPTQAAQPTNQPGTSRATVEITDLRKHRAIENTTQLRVRVISSEPVGSNHDPLAGRIGRLVVFNLSDDLMQGLTTGVTFTAQVDYRSDNGGEYWVEKVER